MRDLRGIEAIAFDLDGTLVDSAPDIRHALNAALEEAGLEHFDLDTVRAWIGDGPDALIAQALCRHGIDADGAARDRLRQAFDVHTLAADIGLELRLRADEQRALPDGDAAAHRAINPEVFVARQVDVDVDRTSDGGHRRIIEGLRHTAKGTPLKGG